MAHHHVSDMTLEELDDFIDANKELMQLSPADRIALHLRRQRRAYLSGKERPPVDDDNSRNGSNGGKPLRRLRILLLGEETNAKLELGALLCGGGSSSNARSSDKDLPLMDLGFPEDVASTPCDYYNSDVDESVRQENTGLLPLSHVELLVPGVADATASLRSELCIVSDVILMCFSITDRGTFDALCQRWWKEEALHAFSVLAQDISDARRKSAVWPLTPVVVVGIGAEARQTALGKHAVAVSHTEAVQLAQEMGASKYIEIISGSLHHARSITTQCMQVVHALNQHLSPATASFLSSARRHMLQRHLLVPTPEGVLDLEAMQLRLRTIPGITYVLTVDGSDPRLHTSRSSLLNAPRGGVIDLKAYCKQPGTLLRICGKARCAYTSAPLDVEVPSTVETPCGFFDMAWRQFTVVPNDIPFTLRDVRYSLDGTQPTMDSLQYIGPIKLDTTSAGEHPWSSWRGSVPPPREVRITAFAEDEFPSPTVVYRVPGVLETPKIVYSQHDSTVSLESMQPMAHYHYTLDGTTPSYESPLYTGPLSLAAADVRQIRFIAFPKLFFPSREAVLHIPNTNKTSNTVITTTSKRNEEDLGRSFHTTRAAMMRGRHAVEKMQMDEYDSRAVANVSSNRVCGGCRGKNQKGKERPVVNAASQGFSSSSTLSPRLRTEARAAMPRCRSGNKDVTRPCAVGDGKAQQVMTTRSARTRSCTAHSVPQSSQPSLKHSATEDDENEDGVGGSVDSFLLMSPVEGENQGGISIRDIGGSKAKKENMTRPLNVNVKMAGGAPLCTAENNTVLFEFPQSISLSHLAVRTPGGGVGPTSYEVEVKHAHGTDFLAVGGGELQDISGVQKMQVLVTARLFPIDQVRCIFSGGAAGFRVTDLKVHGRPFA